MNENQNENVDILISNLDTVMTTSVVPYQVSKSYEIKDTLFTLLQQLNQETYSYSIEIDEYIRNNIKDASFLKRSLIEKINGNLGD